MKAEGSLSPGGTIVEVPKCRRPGKTRTPVSNPERGHFSPVNGGWCCRNHLRNRVSGIPGVGVPGPAAKRVGLDSNSLAQCLCAGQTSLWTGSSMGTGAASPVPAASLEQKAAPEHCHA